MKKNNKAYRTGWVVLIIAVIAAIVLGQVRKPQVSGGLDTSLSTARVEKYVVDNAGILSSGTEKTIHLYNANWMDRWGGVTAVVTVNSADDIEDTAFDWANRLDLNDSCIILTISAGDGESIYIWGYDLDGVMDSRTIDKLTTITDQMTLSGDYDGCIEDFFQLLQSNVYSADFETGYAVGGAPAAADAGTLFFLLLIFAVVLVLILIAIEQSRFATYRRTYYGVVGAPVFRPIFFWHAPGSRWYRRNWRPAPPPPPPRPPRPSSGFGSFFGGSSHSSGGFHSSSGFHSSGGFRAGGGSRSGSGFRAGGSSRSGGGFRAGGSSRSGGFRGRR